jgi:hypothetical protein
MVSDQPAPADPRAASLSGGDNAGPLRLLRHWWQWSAAALVRPAGQEDLEEVALTEGAPWEFPVESPHGVAETPSSATIENRPALCHRERSSLVKNRMRNVAPVVMWRSAPKVAARAGFRRLNAT